MKEFKNIIKYCETCNALLKLNNSRDIERKRFCSKTCLGVDNGKNRDISLLHVKCNTPKANLKKGHKKENHPFWKKDRNSLISRSRFELKNWRNSVFIRDDYTCQMCFKKGGKLNAHHKAPYAIFKALRYELLNGITLCSICHKDLHEAATELFGGLTSNSNQNRKLCHAIC